MGNLIKDRIESLKDKISGELERDELKEESNAEVTDTVEEDELAARVNALHERINFLKNKIHDVQVTNEEEDSEIVEPFDETEGKINEIRDKIQNLKERIQNKIEDDMEEIIPVGPEGESVKNE